MNELWKRREWLTTDEAAIYLSSKTGSAIAEADLFRLALDGHLTLSVHLPASVEATTQEGVGTQPRARRRIDGLWKLPMQGVGRLEVESRYHSLRGLPYVHVDGATGASVTRDGVVCQLPPDPGVATGFSPRGASAPPQGSVIVIRTEVLDAFAAKNPVAPSDASPGDTLERPLGERERTTLLVIIAALAGAAKIDLSKPSKAGAIIETLTVEMGARVSARAVEDHLKRVGDAFDRRRKESL